MADALSRAYAGLSGALRADISLLIAYVNDPSTDVAKFATEAHQAGADTSAARAGLIGAIRLFAVETRAQSNVRVAQRQILIAGIRRVFGDLQQPNGEVEIAASAILLELVR